MTKTFITDKELSEWKELMIESAKKNFLEDGSLMPIALLYCQHKEHRIYGTQFTSDEEKNAFTSFLRQEMKEHDALAYMFISEAWITKYDKDDKDGYKNPDGTYKRPSEDPKRVECIFISFESKLTNEIICIEIDRTDGIKLSNENRNGQSKLGRFHDMLKMPIVEN